MLTKLALRNARRSLRDYLIYLMTMVLITAMMFAFNSMIFSDAVREICTEAGMLAAMLGMATFFIVLIIIWLVHYLGLSAFLTGYIKKGRAGVWKQANIFVLRQLSSKIRTMQFTLGTLTILFMVALIGASCALMLNQFQNTQSDEKWPFDIAVYHQNPEYDFAGEKEADDMNNFLIHNYSLADKSLYYKYDTYMMLSDYNYLRRMLGYPEVSLGKNEYLLHIKSRLAKTAAPFTEQPLDIGGAPYTCAGIYTEGFEQSGHNGADYILIVPDQAAESMKPYYSLLMVQINGTIPKDFGDTLLNIQGITWNVEEYGYEGYGDADAHRGYETDNIYVSDSYTFVRQKEMREMKFLMSTLIFPLFYIGLVFLCAALTVLAVQQLSDSSKYRYRYNLLRKLSLQEKELNRLILKQLFLYYLFPFIGALLISGGIAGHISHAFVTYSGVWRRCGLTLDYHCCCSGGCI